MPDRRRVVESGRHRKGSAVAEPIRIANIAGLFGDRPHAAREVLEGGPVDVLTGDWLAELTMLILARTRSRRPDGGYGRTFVTQMEEVMGTCLDRGVKVVVNAGGLDPLGCAAAVEEVAERLGLRPVVAAITGDDLMPRLAELVAAGVDFAHLDTGEPLGELGDQLVVANAYLGGWGIAAALERGADIVVTGRVTDAALAVGPAIWRHGWARDDWDALAGAVVAGHVIECGAQATGGNYSFFTEVPDLEYPGFPWAEIAEDGSSVIGKHDGTGGEVSVGTVTSQLLYEIGGPCYHNPDVTARFDSIEIRAAGPDRVRIGPVTGEPPPPHLKVAAAVPGGYRNSVMIGLTGSDVEAKADLVQRQFWRACRWDPSDYDEVRATLIGTPATDPADNAAAITFLEIAVKDRDEEKVGRAWSNVVAQIALGSIPGFFGLWPPSPARPFARYWPTLVPRRFIRQTVHLGGESLVVDPTDPGPPRQVDVEPTPPPPPPSPGPTVRAPLGRVVGARSGDKGGNANLGVFVRDRAAYPWMVATLTTDGLRRLLPDLAPYRIDRYEFPRLGAVNFVIHGLLDGGVSSALRVDPQAKGLGEYLRSRHVDVPRALVEP